MPSLDDHLRVMHWQTVATASDFYGISVGPLAALMLQYKGDNDPTQEPQCSL